MALECGTDNVVSTHHWKLQCNRKAMICWFQYYAHLVSAKSEKEADGNASTKEQSISLNKQLQNQRVENVAINGENY